MTFALATILLLTMSASALDPSDLMFIILSQEEGYNAAQAKLVKENLIEQAEDLGKEPPKVILSHEVDAFGSWTITPIIAAMAPDSPQQQWFFICAENTAVRLPLLLNVLGNYNVEIHRNLWLGHVLHDKEPSVVHHYAEHAKKFKYPNLSSGFALSKHLFKSLAKKAADAIESKVDFSLDAAYEFANFVLLKGKNARMTHEPKFCIASNDNCATYPKPFYPCSEIVPREKVYVAVKTCSKYHLDRLPAIRNTWAKYATNIGFYTDRTDINLPDGYVVPNTEQGHCIKTYSILRHADAILRNKTLHWLIITDDDTILSLGRLLNLLTCYNPVNTIALGERYGYRATKIHGYDYLTGGAGVVLSAPLVRQLIAPGTCECPSPSTPDDMYLFGVCLAHIEVPLTHSPLFHQARPDDYPTALLAAQEPVSFHRFWMIDPFQVYEHWFAEADESAFREKEPSQEHIEL